MGERDAFGREKGEDTLADMGWRGGAAPAGDPMSAGEAVRPFAKPVPVNKRPPAPVAPAPVAAAAPSPPADVLEAPRPAFAPPRAYPRRRRRGGSGMARLVVFIAVLGAVGLGATSLFTAGKGAVKGIVAALPTPASPSPKPKAASSGSLLREKPLRAVLAKLPAGRVFTLRVAPDKVSAIVDHGRTRHVVQLGADGSKVDVKTPSVALDLPGAKVVPAAPYKIARKAARLSHHSVSDVDYLVLTSDGWELFFKDGAHFHATPSGAKVTKRA